MIYTFPLQNHTAPPQLTIRVENIHRFNTKNEYEKKVKHEWLICNFREAAMPDTLIYIMERQHLHTHTELHCDWASYGIKVWCCQQRLPKR